jgi:uncharacterized protein (TIGR02246 family)
MKNFAFISLIISTFVFAAFGQKTNKPAPAKTPTTATAKATADDEKAVRNVFEDLLTGIRTSNVDGVTDTYWNSPQTLYFNSNGSVTRGSSDDRKNREARYPKTSNVKLDVRNVVVTMLGKDGALITCQWKQTQDYEANPESASGRMTLVLKRIDKDWKIIHLHSSPDNPPATRPVFPSEKEN